MDVFSRGVIFVASTSLAVVFIEVSLEGCTQDASTVPPIVSSPVDPWEVEVERGMLRRDFNTPTPTPMVETWEAPDASSSPEEHGVAQTVLADIIGFPFRAAAWLAHVLL